MAIEQNRKMEHAIGNVLSRDQYLVTQANDLARSFGKLTTFQHKVLDYCFSSVQKDDPADKKYVINSAEMIKYFGMRASGASYNRIVEAFHALNEGTAIYLKVKRANGDWGIRMTSLFGYIDTYQSGRVEFSFNQYVAPYVFQLKKQFYSFKLSELSRVHSKYTLTLMKLWNAYGMGKWDPEHHQLPDAVIQGSLEDWESWFIGVDDKGKPKHWPAGRFRQNALDVAIKEIGKLYPNIVTTLETHTDRRKVIGYRLDIHPVNTHLNMGSDDTDLSDFSTEA